MLFPLFAIFLLGSSLYSSSYWNKTPKLMETGGICPTGQSCQRNCPIGTGGCTHKILGLYEALGYLHKRCGYKIKNVLDVGANSGDWSLDLSRFISHPDMINQKNASFFLIEGNPHHEVTLKETGYPFEISLVADVEKEVKFYVEKTGVAKTGSSMFKEHGLHTDEVIRQARPIDEIVARRNVGPFDAMKIDIQGAEILALKGAKKTLETVNILFLEVSIMQYNLGGAEFFELHSVLDALGFAIMDIIDIFRFDPQDSFALQIDIMCVKKTSFLWSKNCTGFENQHHHQ